MSSGTPSPKPSEAQRGRPGKVKNAPDMGSALRSVYQETVEEDVPDEMLDLLKKLG